MMNALMCDFVEYLEKDKKVAKIAIDGMMSGKTVIVPGMSVKFGRFMIRFLPESLLTAVAYKFQGLKNSKNEE